MMMIINNKKGAALVELALILPLLLLIVFGICEFGRAMFITNTLNNAARYGARLAVVSAKPLNTDALKAEIKSNTPLSTTDLDLMAISISPISPPSGTAVKVTATIPFSTVVPFMADFFPSSFTLKGEASMRYEL